MLTHLHLSGCKSALLMNFRLNDGLRRFER